MSTTPDVVRDMGCVFFLCITWNML